MSNYARQTKKGQMGLLVVAFATPFALMIGTGGYAQAQPITSSGNSCFVTGAQEPAVDEVNRAIFFKDVGRFENEYGLSKNQLAALLNVSRPTINSWLKKEPERIRDAHKQRLAIVLSAFDERIDLSLRCFSGSLLQKKLDPTVSKLLQMISNENYESNEMDDILRRLNFKLAGVSKSVRLREALKDKKRLI